MPDPDNFIRITYDDANSEHVESLLRRQMSLRGERGITNVRSRRWFYQNWFILMIAGGVFAFAAWALIEPYFDDMVWLQGKITNTAIARSVQTDIDVRGDIKHVSLPTKGWIEFDGGAHLDRRARTTVVPQQGPAAEDRGSEKGAGSSRVHHS